MSEFAQLDSGERVILHRDRGFTIRSNEGEVRALESAASITATVLNVVLPDDDEVMERHPWTWLAELALTQGLDVAAEQLERLPYEVVLTSKVQEWLAGARPAG